MGDFSVFYFNGGVFMHVITVMAGLGAVAMVQHGRARRSGDARLDRLRLSERIAFVCVMIGLLGTLFGVFDLCMALSMIEGSTEDLIRAGARGAGIAPIPFAWGLMCAIPIWLAGAVHRYRGPKTITREGSHIHAGV